jgi:hypothetical protein
MAPPTPDELVARHGRLAPEALAAALGYTVVRRDATDLPAQVRVFSEFAPSDTIVLYLRPLHGLAAARGIPQARLEQWHIAHELYHALAEASGDSPWRVRETEADLWADELVAVMGDATP